MTRIVLDYPPSANRYWRAVNGRILVSREARAYKMIAACQSIWQGIKKPLDGELVVTLRFYRPQRSGDLDNYVKVALDSLNGVVWYDDKQIVEIHSYRYDDKARPRVEVEVSAPVVRCCCSRAPGTPLPVKDMKDPRCGDCGYKLV